jgi:hypothetical protein
MSPSSPVRAILSVRTLSFSRASNNTLIMSSVNGIFSSLIFAIKFSVLCDSSTVLFSPKKPAAPFTVCQSLKSSFTNSVSSPSFFSIAKSFLSISGILSLVSAMY